VIVLVYLDSSVLARAYLGDEPGHERARGLVEGEDFVVTSTLALVEVTSALVRATRAGRVADLETLLDKLDEETQVDGPITLIRADQLDAENVARQLVRDHVLRALDALHLAVAELSARPLAGDNEDVGFASRDSAQRNAAEALGFVVV
jgi:predicted nucleic acid-binding protein